MVGAVPATKCMNAASFLLVVVFGGVILFLLWGLILNKKFPSPTTAANPPGPVVAVDGSDLAVDEISRGKHPHQDHPTHPPGHSGWFDGGEAHGGGDHGGFAGGSHH